MRPALPALTPLIRRLPQHPPLSAAALAALALLSLPAQAQSTTQDPVQLEAVTVTATRRVESLQQVPIAVSVVRGDDLERSNRNTLGSLSSLVPSLNFRTGASNKDTSLFVRGVGTISTSPGVEPTVSTVIDGVVFARPGQATLDLADIDRVEVLRGAQGTLFGKNASAGVLNVTTRQPSKLGEGFVELAQYGAGNETRLKAGLSGPLADGLRGGVTVLAARHDGNVRNVFNGDTVNGYEKRGLRGKLVADLGASTQLTLSADALFSADDIPTGVVTRTSTIAFPSGTVSNFPAFAAALAPVQAGSDNREINANLRTRVADRNRGAAATLEHRLPGGQQLTSVTAWRAWDNTQWQDGDRLSSPAAGLPQSHDKGDVDFEQWSQELRLASAPGGEFDYVAGLYHLQTKNREVYRREVQRIGTGGARFDDFGQADYGTRSRSSAVFGEAGWRFAPDWRALAGARFTQDSLRFDHQRVRSTPDAQFNGALPGVNPPVSQAGSTEADGGSGRLGLQTTLAPDVLAYATVSRGYKGPAFNVFFNMLARDTLALKPETSKGAEIGLKSEWLQRRLRLNLAAFTTDYDNYQANFFDLVDGAVVTRLINAGAVRTRGVEADLSARITPAFTVGLNLAHVKARIERFNCPVGAAASCAVNGKPLPFSPDWKGALQANYRLQLSGGLQLDLGAEVTGQSKVQYDIGQFADTIQGGYGIVNASAALSEGNWRVALLAKNLGDRSYASFLGRGGTYVNRWVPRDDQRYVGVQARYAF